MLCSTIISEHGGEAYPFMLYGDTLMDHLDTAAAIGYRGVELQIADPGAFDRYSFINKCSRLEMTITSIGTGLAVKEGLSLSSPKAAVREKAVCRMKAQLDFASEIGAGTIVQLGLLKGLKRDCPDEETYRRNLIRSVTEIAQYAEQKEAVIAFEPINHYESDILNTWDSAASFIEEVSSKSLKLSLDLYHMRFEEKDILASIRKHGGLIGSVQLMDENRMYPGGGCFRFEPVIDAILETGYNGAIIMECLPLPTPETALRKSIEFYNKHFSFS